MAPTGVVPKVSLLLTPLEGRIILMYVVVCCVAEEVEYAWTVCCEEDEDASSH